MIKPTVGRVVLYWPRSDDEVTDNNQPDHEVKQPHAATVAYVWSDNCVNLSIVDHSGYQYSKTSVTLAQDNDPVAPGMAEWMPYQKQQAEKAASVEEGTE